MTQIEVNITIDTEESLISSDNILMGKIRVVKNDSNGNNVSKQIVKTLEKSFALEYSSAKDELLGYVRSGINLGGEDYTFDTSYEVPPSDTIDTSIFYGDNKDDLFCGEAVWDINHILNKYTIPQLNTNTLNIKIASSSLSGKE